MARARFLPVLMLEHDAKQLLDEHGVAVPRGVLIEAGATPIIPFAPPWIVKAQVPVGGRGKAGGVRSADGPEALSAILPEILGMRIGGHPVRSCRVEQAVAAETEAYLSLSVAPEQGGVAILMSAQGGIDVEHGGTEAMLRGQAPAELGALRAEIGRMAAKLPPPVGHALGELGGRLACILLEIDALLVEINPVFVRTDGSWVAGDAKVIVDDNAIFRRPRIARLLQERGAAYPAIRLKLDHGFDFVVLDQQGTIGLVTTGAGLSMMLIDEMRARGLRPFNFCDIRTGQMRGDPKRLVDVLGWITEGRAVRAVLVNIFAGITDLREFARLLIEAVGRVPHLRVPIVARIIGNGEAEARDMLASSGLPIMLEPDLDRAVRLVAGAAEAGRHA